jgi:hypothetical protein
MSLNKKITDLLPDQIPDYVQEFYPLFVIFVTKYFEWLEQAGNAQDVIQNLQLDADIDTAATSLATKFLTMYAPHLPQTAALDRSILIKHFRDFYLSKGSEESFRYFFRAFFDDEISIALPGNQLFKTSNADWYIEKILRVNAVTGDPRHLTAVEITGTSSNATAVVEEVVNSYGAWDLRLQNRTLSGTFSSSETITAVYHDFVNDVSSQIVVQNTKELQVLPGRQRGTDSLLSADQVIQDSFYWQKFSYVVRTRIDLSRWQDAVLEQLHPSGRNLFGEILLDNSTSMSVSSATQFVRSTALESQVSLFSSSNSFYLVPGYTWDRLGYGRTGTSATNLVTAGTTVVSYDAGYIYGGENVTFALQGITDTGEVLEETITYTSITGTVSVNITTSVTTTNRDIVSYSMPVTSITGTISAATVDVSSTITLTGVSTLFAAEIEPNNVWRRVTGQDVGLNPIYEYNTSVLTIRQLAVTGTATIASQTPVAPEYLLYVSGIGTRFRSDLLVSTETTAPIVESGQPEPLLYLDNYILTGDFTFTSGSTSVVGVNSLFTEINQLSTSTLTVIKPLRGLFTQVSSVPGIATSTYEVIPGGVALGGSYVLTTISGTTLTYSATTSNASSINATAQGAYGTDRAWRIDIPTPFPVQFLTTSTNTLYVHASGFIASGTSAPSHYSSTDTFAKFRPFTGPYVGVYPNYLNNLASVHWGTQGSAPNRYFTIHYNGTYGRATVDPGTTIGYSTAMTLRGTAGAAGGGTLGAAKSRTSGTTTNGYYEITTPWGVYFGGTSYSKIYVSHNSRVAFGNWIAYDSSQTITRSGYLSGIIPHLDLCNYSNIAGYVDTYIYYNVTSVSAVYYNTFGTAPERTFVVRFEGDHQSGALVRVIWELEFPEAYPGSIYVNFGHPAQTTANTYPNLGSIGVSTIQWGESGTGGGNFATYSGAYTQFADYVTDSSGASIYAAVTSGMVKITGGTNYAAEISGLDIQNNSPRGGMKWEMSFPENSASPYILRTGLTKNRLGTLDAYTPSTFPTPNFKPYGATSGTNYNPNWEWGEAPVTSAPSSLVWPGASIPSSSTATVSFTKIPPSSQLDAPIPQTSGLVLLRAHTQWRTSSTIATASSVSTFLELGIDSTNYPAGGFVPGSRACDTSTGLLARFPQDGYNATANNTNPNPCISITSQVATYCYNRTSNFYTNYTYYITSTAGLMFAYGSSASTHSRFVQSVPTFGRTHVTNIRFLVGTGNNTSTNTNVPYYSTLNRTTAGQDLELWYQLGDNPQPPTNGVSPSTLGWTRYSTLFYGGSSTGFSYGGVVGKSATITTASDTSLSWLIWQKSFTGTGTNSNTSLSNYLLTYWAMSSTMTATGSNSSNTALYFAGNRLQLGSGSVVRIPNRTTKTGTAVLEDFYVAENPRLRSFNGDAYLVLRPVSTVTSVPYVDSINNWYTSAVTSYGIYSAALTNIPVYMVETRTINNIVNQTTLTVTAAWSSTSNRNWTTQGSGYSTRVFAINSVITDTGLSLRALSQASSRYLPPVASLTTASTLLADRRFTVVGVANNTTITVSGGGIYTNITNKTATFARRETGIEGYAISGYHDGSNFTANTTWVSSGLPGTDYLGNNYGIDLNRLTVTIGNSSFTVVRVVNDTTILVTGSIITANFWDTSMVSRFPAPSSQIVITGTGTKFLASSVVTTGATAITTITEEVTEYDYNDRRTGYLLVNGQVFSIVEIVSDTVLVASSNAVTAAISGATGEAFKRVSVGATGRQLANPGGASFDKFGANITNDDTLVVQDVGVNYALVRELYHNTSALTLASSSVIRNTSISLSAGSSVILLVTWIKDLNVDISIETYNALNITVSSTGTFIANFNDETQRNHRDIAVGRSLMYAKSVYLNSSNSITSTNVVSHGDTTGTAVWNWTPSNIGRPGAYSRFSAVLGSSSATSMTIYVKVADSVSSTWNTGSLDFLNITVIGVS